MMILTATVIRLDWKILLLNRAGIRVARSEVDTYIETIDYRSCQGPTYTVIFALEKFGP